MLDPRRLAVTALAALTAFAFFSVAPAEAQRGRGEDFVRDEGPRPGARSTPPRASRGSPPRERGARGGNRRGGDRATPPGRRGGGDRDGWRGGNRGGGDRVSPPRRRGGGDRDGWRGGNRGGGDRVSPPRRRGGGDRDGWRGGNRGGGDRVSPPRRRGGGDRDGWRGGNRGGGDRVTPPRRRGGGDRDGWRGGNRGGHDGWRRPNPRRYTSHNPRPRYGHPRHPRRYTNGGRRERGWYAQRRRDFWRDRARLRAQTRWLRHLNSGWSTSIGYYGHWGAPSRWRYHNQYYSRGYNGRDFAYYDGICTYRDNGEATLVGALLGAIVGGAAANDDDVAVGVLLGAGAGALIGNSVGRLDDCDRGQYQYAVNYAFEYGEPYYWGNPHTGVRGAIIIRDTYQYGGYECRWGDAEIYMPDGTYNYDRVRMCRDEYGEWRVANHQ